MPDPLAMRVGGRIRVLRKERGFSFDAFVEETGLGRGYVSELERGLVVPTLRILDAVAKALELTMADVVLGDSPREVLFQLLRHLPSEEVEALLSRTRAASGPKPGVEASGRIRRED